MPAADSRSDALSHSETDEHLAVLNNFDHAVLAVSGGGDSVALLYLTAEWKARHPDGPKVSVLTVDHGVRARSAREARCVAEWSAALGLPHETLAWTLDRPASGFQAAARTARYNLMIEWCKHRGADVVVTAHTLDDQAETLLMRLSRGSGVEGLSAMPVVARAPWPVVRPLLGVSRARLRATLCDIGAGWFDDPSNEDPRYERIRIRHMLHTLQAEGLDAAQIALSARRLQRANAALDEAAARLTDSVVDVHSEGYGCVDRQAFADAPEELQIRLLQRLVWMFGGHSVPKMAGIERLRDWIVAGSGRARTLGGSRLARRKSSFLVGREPGRIDPEPVPLTSRNGMAECVWDGRFCVKLRGEAGVNDVAVVPRGTIDMSDPKLTDIPSFVREGLPSIVRKGRVVWTYPDKCHEPGLDVSAAFIGGNCRSGHRNCC